MPLIKSKLKNQVGDIVLEYLFTQAINLKHDPIVPNRKVQNYLNDFEPFKRILLDEMDANGMDSALIEILDRFLQLIDERAKDGSIEKNMLCYHSRVAYRLCQYFLFNKPRNIEEEFVNILVGLNFNKPCLVDYYQREISSSVANGEMPNPHTNIEPNDRTTAFNPICETMESLRQRLFPCPRNLYEEKSEGLKDQIKAAIAQQ